MQVITLNWGNKNQNTLLQRVKVQKPLQHLMKLSLKRVCRALLLCCEA